MNANLAKLKTLFKTKPEVAYGATGGVLGLGYLAVKKRKAAAAAAAGPAVKVQRVDTPQFGATGGAIGGSGGAPDYWYGDNYTDPTTDTTTVTPDPVDTTPTTDYARTTPAAALPTTTNYAPAGTSYFLPRTTSQVPETPAYRYTPPPGDLPVTSPSNVPTVSWAASGLDQRATPTQVAAARLPVGTPIAGGLAEMLAAKTTPITAADRIAVDNIQADLGLPGVYSPAPAYIAPTTVATGAYTSGTVIDQSKLVFTAPGVVDQRQFYTPDGEYDWTAANIARAMGYTISGSYG